MNLGKILQAMRSRTGTVTTQVVVICLALISLVLLFLLTENWAAPLIFGPEDFVRAKGKPQVISRTFTVANPAGAYTLCISNGDQQDQYLRVASAEVTLNKVKVVQPQLACCSFCR